MSAAGKLYEGIFKARIEKEIVEKEEQSGFRSGRYRDLIQHICPARPFLERAMELNVDFIDSSFLQKLWTVMTNKTSSTSIYY